MQNLTVGSKPSCANDSENATPCKNFGSLACKDCLMVTYCSKRCQVAHWPIHRKDCKSPLMKKTWKPSWVAQNRPPAFVGDESSHIVFGTPKYLWGNAPAVDMIRLSQNEGVDFQGPVHMLFAASGDMRNAVLSVASLPPSYRGPLSIVINDREIDVVARNVILLLIFFVEENPTVAAEYVLHVWYSALITAPCSSMLRDKLKPMVEYVCNKIAQKPGSALLGRTWKFGESSLRLVLTRDNWFSLLSYFDVPQGLAKDAAQHLRQMVVSAPERVDYVERAMCTKSPSARLGIAKFRSDGILLPFGQPRGAFAIPNPCACPVITRLRSMPVTFDLLHVDARLLPNALVGQHFDRIDVSNICDMGYLGIDTTLKTFAPLLQLPSVNQHATLVTLFLNAVAEMKMMAASIPAFIDYPLREDHREQMKKVLQYMPELGRQVSQPYDPSAIKLISALSLVHDMDKNFNRYMEVHEFADVALGVGLQMKAAHTIIDAWPMKLSDGRPTSKAKEDFALLLSSCHTGQERFVEWKLTAEASAEDVD
ncbi:hypothetical protein DL767_006689 [Monosporascus sp. MG133]|nr:hypothetical protein DL767_006689 [Monosporascus sp. MG133]